MSNKEKDKIEKDIIENTWLLLNNTIKAVKRENINVSLVGSAKEIYSNIFMKEIKYIKDNYMRSNVLHLDRHKTAGIIIYSVLKAKAIKYEGCPPKDSNFFGEYLVAGSLGINYMIDRLNAVLKKKDKKKRQITKLWMPEHVFSCEVPYFEIFCRNLYFAEQNEKWGINPLDLSEKLFLLEYITVEKEGIDPIILKENANESIDL